MYLLRQARNGMVKSQCATLTNQLASLGPVIVNRDLQLIVSLVSISSTNITINRTSCRMDFTPYLLCCCYVVQTVLPRVK